MEQFTAQKKYFESGETLDINHRICCLLKLKQTIISYEQDILDALKADFGKCGFDTYTTEILMVLNELDTFVKHLKRWSKPYRAGTGLPNFPAFGKIYRQPLGVVLIISPWNYPFMLAMSPLVGAIAAGNCVILKPSAQAAHTAIVIKKILSEVFLPEHTLAIIGDHHFSDRLLEQPFDLIFFTGSPAVGRHVMEKAAAHLTPVILELGGKSPCIVEKSADLQNAAKRIVWGKFVNAGQTCVAPDYLLVDRMVAEPLLEEIKRCIRMFYYENDHLSEDFPKIINERHFLRLTSYFSNGEIVCGGGANTEERRIEPTVLRHVSVDSPVMQEEIFGPVLPVLEYEELEEAVRFVSSRPKPLALYFFSKDKRRIKNVIKYTSSGGGCINDTVMHVSSDKLPFGGVGKSGMGIYHGKYSFDTFSNIRSILYKNSHWELNLKYPPHGMNKIRTLKRLLRKK